MHWNIIHYVNTREIYKMQSRLIHVQLYITVFFVVLGVFCLFFVFF